MLDQLLANAIQFQHRDVANFGIGQRRENDRCVNAVEKLRTEHPLEFVFHFFARIVEFNRATRSAEADPRTTPNLLGANVRGHNNDRVAEIHPPTFAIGQVAIFQHLQQQIERVGVGFFDFVEQHHAVWAATHRIGQLAAFAIADVAGRRTDQPRRVETFLKLRHINLDQGFFRAEHKLGQRFRQQCFAYAGWPQENKRAYRSFRVFQTSPRPPHRSRNDRNRFFLPDDALVQIFFHLHQAGGFFAGQPRDRNTRPHTDNFGDVFFGDVGLAA